MHTIYVHKPIRLTSPSGFSLVELLAVLAVISVLSALSVMGLSSLYPAGKFTRSLSDLNGIIEQAKITATSQNTYVWLGLLDDGGKDGIYVSVVSSLSGENDLTASNLRPVIRPTLLSQVGLENDVARNNSLANSIDPSLLEQLTTNTNGTFSTKFAGQTKTFTLVLRFTPQGEVSCQPNTSSRWIEIGLKNLQGTSPNVASLQVSGLGGNVRLVRP
ncbi:MAG: prepilin-type N-terminal cleavage/methylation domain-containing protein [Candidatus Methylacidiphilales bacterium]|nr:prepilin-type N-terminal cleavage/methylation domain-containing protein [Candidatus Methylacidiphilales bacterium]